MVCQAQGPQVPHGFPISILSAETARREASLRGRPGCQYVVDHRHQPTSQ